MVRSGTHAVGPGLNRTSPLMMFRASPLVLAGQGVCGMAVLVRCVRVLPGWALWQAVALRPWRGGTSAVLAGLTATFNRVTAITLMSDRLD